MVVRCWRGLTALLCFSLLAAACGGAEPAPPVAGDPTAAATTTAPATGPTGPAGGTDAAVSGTIRLYTSVTQDTVDAVVAAYEQAHPDVGIEVFRAPTGELSARIAAEQREDGIAADVLWLTDPLSAQQFAADGLLQTWTPPHAEAILEDYREDSFWGTRLLNMVIVHQEGLDPAPTAWDDLATSTYPAPVAIPDPGFAGSAFGALGYFALAEDFGFDYYRALADRGAVQVQAPDEVVTGVAEGRFAAGMTLDRSARDAVEAGSPIEMVVPAPGAIAIYSPIAVVEGSAAPAAAESFVDFTLTAPAQEAIAGTGWQPVHEDVGWEHGGATVAPDWDAIFDRQDELLEEYREIFPG